MKNVTKIVLTGGPHTGKTTLLNGLRQELPVDIYFVPEPAELLIRQELEKHDRNLEYEPVLPTTNYAGFVRMLVDESVRLELAIPVDANKAVLDRSLIDNIGFARLYGHGYLVPSIRELARVAGYHVALICDFVGTYTQTAVRPETEEFAHAVHERLLEAYGESGLETIHIPPLKIKDRLALAKGIIENL